MNPIFVSAKSDEWATPKYIYSQVEKLKMFDPCPLGGSVDGLAIEWGQNCFVNPPYSDLKKWVDKSIEEAKKGKSILLLIPSRTDTKAFRKLYLYGCLFVFVQGRLKFNDLKCAPFPSMFVKLCGGVIQKFKLSKTSK